MEIGRTNYQIQRPATRTLKRQLTNSTTPFKVSMTVSNDSRFQFSARSMLTLTTVVALIAAAIGKYAAVAYAAAALFVFVLCGIGRIALAYFVGYGIVLPIALIFSTPIVLVLALFQKRPSFRATLEIYRKISQSFVAFFEQGGYGIV